MLLFYCGGFAMYDIAITGGRRPREFRYDGARARYMNRKLSADLITDLGTTWSDYDGDEAYGDFTVSTANPPVVSNTDAYQPGLWRKVGTASEYLHSDMLGTLRTTSGTTGSGGASRVFTAFGERITTTTDRFGYVGAWGYQSNPIPESPNPDTAFPYLHLGARYYDSSSGRFLQRDPIGVHGGLNVYAYPLSPSTRIDPSGLNAVGDGLVTVGQSSQNAGYFGGGVALICAAIPPLSPAAIPIGATSGVFIVGGFISEFIGRIINWIW